MIPISLSWDSEKRLVALKWNGLFSSGLKNGKVFINILGIPLPLRFKKIRPKPPKVYFPIRWMDVKGAFSFLREWRLKKVEGTFSFPDPMVNGILYGWMSAVQTVKADQKINVSINFLGETWCRGEVSLSLKALFYHLWKWILPLFREIWGRRSRKGGKQRWKPPI